MKKLLLISLIISVNQLFIFVVYSQTEKYDTLFDSSSRIVEMKVHFMPNMEGPCYFNMTQQSLLMRLPYRIGLTNSQEISYGMSPSLEKIDDFNYEIYALKDGGYMIDVHPLKSYFTKYCYSLQFDKDGYGDLTVYEKSGDKYYSLYSYGGFFSYVIKEYEDI